MGPMERSGAHRDPQKGPEVRVGPDELAALLFQTILLAASLGFMAATVLSRLSPLPRPLAFGLGLEIGLLASYPTIRIVARSNGTVLGFWKWFGLTLVPSVLGITLLSVV